MFSTHREEDLTALLAWNQRGWAMRATLLITPFLNRDISRRNMLMSLGQDASSPHHSKSHGTKSRFETDSKKLNICVPRFGSLQTLRSAKWGGDGNTAALSIH